MNVSVVSRELFGDLLLKDAPPFLRNLRRGILVFYAFTCLIIIASAIGLSLLDYKESLNAAQQQSMALSRSLEEHAARSLSAVEQTMQGLTQGIQAAGGAENAGEERLHELLELRQAHMPQMRGIVVINHEGILSAHSNEFPAKKLKLSDRSYFLYHSKQPGQESRIGEPLISRTDYRWLVPITMRMDDRKGRFDGLILAGIEPDYFLEFYDSLHLDRGIRIQILRKDGILLLGYPLDIHRLGTKLADKSDGFSLQPGSHQAGAQKRFVAQVSSQDMPIRVRIVMDASRVLTRFNHDLHIRAVTVLAVLAVLSGMLLFLLRQTGQVEQAETRLRLTQSAFDVSPDIIVWCERSGRIVYANRQLSSFTGYPAEEVKKLHLQKLINMNDPDWEQFCSEALIANGRTLETSLFRKDSSYGTLELSVFPLTGTTTPLLCILGRDITERHTRESELLRHREHLQEMIQKQTTEIGAVLDATPLAVILIVNEHIKSVNPAFETLFGYSLSSVTGLPESVIHTSATSYLGIRNTIRSRIAKGGTYRGEVELRRSDGSLFWAQIFARALHPLPTDAGTVYILEDISAQRCSAQALRQSEQIKRTILDTATDGFALVDLNHRFIDVNHALCLQTGVSREFIIGKTPGELWGTELAEKIFPRDISQGTELPRLEIGLLCRDENRTFLVSPGLIRNSHGATEYLFSFFSDITGQKQVEHALKEAREVAEQANQTKSIFLTNMSHELRTPMHAILSFAELGIQRSAESTAGEAARYFERINQAGKHLLALLNDLLDMSRMVPSEQRFKFGTHILQQTMSATLSEISFQLEEKQLQVIHDETSKVISAEYDRMGIVQVILNLMSNAIRFSPVGGKIHISYLQEPAGTNSPTMCGFSIRDEGPGISDDQIGHVNEVLESGHSPETDQTSSLGLALCRQIIHKHEGRIRAENHPAGGAILTVLLPWAENAGKA